MTIKAHVPGRMLDLRQAALSITAHTAMIPARSAQTIHFDFMPTSHGRHSAKLPFSEGKIMSLATRMRERFRVRLARFVEKERARRGSAKEAMAAVSRKIGLSAITLYRILNRHERPVKVEDHHHAALIIHSLGLDRLAAKIRAKRRHAASLHA